MTDRIDIVPRLRILWTSCSDQINAERNFAADEIERLRAERDEAMVLVETIAYDVDVLSTRPAAIVKLSDLVYHINEWGDAARSILSKKDNTNV